MNWRRLVAVLHRDLGYFFAGATILFAVSGLAVNHIGHWDPDFIIKRHPVNLVLPADSSSLNAATVERALDGLDTEVGQYRTHDRPSAYQLKIYLDDGSILANRATGEGEYESVRQRPLLYAFNRLHLDPASWWLVFSDAFAVGLIVLAITGVLILRGRHGLLRRGKWLVGAGLLAPAIGIVVFG